MRGDTDGDRDEGVNGGHADYYFTTGVPLRIKRGDGGEGFEDGNGSSPVNSKGDYYPQRPFGDGG